MNQIILKHLIFQCILILYYLTPENNSCQSFSFDDMGFVVCSLENSSEILNHTDKVPVSTLHLTIRQPQTIFGIPFNHLPYRNLI